MQPVPLPLWRRGWTDSLGWVLHCLVGWLLAGAGLHIPLDTSPVVVAVDSKVRRTQEASDLAQVEAGLDFAEACLDLHTARNHSYHLPAVRDTQDALGEHLVELTEEELEACLAVGLEAFQACLALPDQVPCPEQAAQGSFHGSWGWVVSLAVRWRGSGRVSAGDQPVIGELVAGALQGNLGSVEGNSAAALGSPWAADQNLAVRGAAGGWVAGADPELAVGTQKLRGGRQGWRGQEKTARWVCDWLRSRHLIYCLGFLIFQGHSFQMKT